MSDVLVRPTTPEDAPAMVALAADLREWFNPDVPEEVRADCARCTGWAAVDAEGGLVGFALGLASGDEYVIKWLAVARERHRHGVGKLLIGRLIETARSSSLKRLVVDTLAATHDYEPYARTRAFYEACGFTLERIERAGFPEGSDKAVYVLPLAACPARPGSGKELAPALRGPTCLPQRGEENERGRGSTRWG